MILKKYLLSTVRNILLLLVIQFVFFSCEETIDINVEEIDQKIVIDASISDSQNSNKVLLSMTQNAFKQGGNTIVTGAKIYLSDNNGNLVTANEYQPGKYSLPSFNVNYGDNYKLKVTANGKEYSGSSQLNEPMKLDSVSFSPSLSSSIWGFNHYYYKLNLYLNNKPGVDEYCMINFTGVYSTSKHSIVYQDKYAADKQIILNDGNSTYQKNESVTIEIFTIDKAAYDFFFHLNELSGGNGIDIPELFNITSYNPKTNLSNGALGCFYAYSYKKYTFVVK